MSRINMPSRLYPCSADRADSVEKYKRGEKVFPGEAGDRSHPGHIASKVGGPGHTGGETVQKDTMSGDQDGQQRRQNPKSFHEMMPYEVIPGSTLNRRSLS